MEERQPRMEEQDRAALELSLMQRAHSGDRTAQRDLIEQLRGPVRRTVLYLAGGHRDIDDLCQLALVEILYSAGSFRGDASLYRWAEKITVRTALRHLKSLRRKDRTTDEWRDELAELGDMDRSVDARQVRMRLAALMQHLSPENRAVMVLHYVHEYRISEIAEITGAKVNTVRGRLKSGRTKLRRRILADPLVREWVKKGYMNEHPM